MKTVLVLAYSHHECNKETFPLYFQGNLPERKFARNLKDGTESYDDITTSSIDVDKAITRMQGVSFDPSDSFKHTYCFT